MSKQNKGSRRKSARSSVKREKSLRRRAKVADKRRKESLGEERNLENEFKDLHRKEDEKLQEQHAPLNNDASGDNGNLTSDELLEKIEQQEEDIEKFKEENVAKIKREFEESMDEARESVRDTYRKIIEKHSAELETLDTDDSLTRAEVRNRKQGDRQGSAACQCCSRISRSRSGIPHVPGYHCRNLSCYPLRNGHQAILCILLVPA